MKYYYLNKFVMAVLVALLLFFGTRTLIDILHHQPEPEKPGYDVVAKGDEGEGKQEEKVDEGAAFIVALNEADPAKGEQDIGACKGCHSFDKGGPTMLGPNLYGIVGHKIAAIEGVNYSPALKDHGGDWTFENLDQWLKSPQQFAAGTIMAFPGIPDLKKRASVIAYLNKNSDDPLPLPEPKEEPAADGAAKEAAGQPEVIALLATADAAKGEQGIAVCKACHSFEKGGPTMLGPNLYGIVGHKIAAIEGVNYSPALKDHGGDWTFENLDAWLKSPQEFASGTIMAFPGIPDAKKRADVIAYLNQNSDDPVPLPEAKEEPAAEEPAEEPAADDAAEEPAAEEPAEEAADQSEVLGLLATADAAKGEQSAAFCKACHSFDAGGPTMVGPNLHNIVGAKIAGVEGFSYSEALKSKDGVWTYEQLDAWLAGPMALVPGTTMAFPGVPDAKTRADIIAFLVANTENPPPLPGGDEAAAPAEGEAAPADDEAAPAEEEAAPAADEAAPAEEEVAPAEGEAAPSDEPAAEAPPAAVEAPPAAVEEEATEETVVVPPTVSEDAPSEPHKGEAPSPNQPQPVYPDEEPAAEAPAAAMEEDTAAETVVVPPAVSEDAPSEPHKGEAPSPNQPQPVYPDEEPAAEAPAAAMEDAPEESADAPSESHMGEAPSPSQPQPVYPDGKPEGI